MTINVTDGLATFSGVLAIVGILSGLAAYFKVGLSKSTIQELRDSNRDYRDRQEQLETDAQRNKETIMVQERQIAHLKGENETLRTVTAAPLIAELKQTIADGFKDMTAALMQVGKSRGRK